MAIPNKRDLILQGIERGKTPDEIDKALSKWDLGSLNKIERQQIKEGTYGTTFLERASKGFKGFQQGINTLGGAAWKAARDPEYRQQLGDTIGNYLKDKGIGGVVNDAANLILEPYNLTTKKIVSQSPVETLTDVGAGIVNHPIQAALDIGAPVVSRLNKGGKIQQAIQKAPLPQPTKDFVTTPHMDEVNQGITQSKSIVANQRANATANIEKVKQSQGDLPTAIRNAERGVREGDEATIQLTEDLKGVQSQYQNILRDLGVSDEAAKTTSVNQYVYRNLPKDNQKGIPLATISDTILNPTPNKLKRLGVTQDELNQLVADGNQLYDKGLIFPISHRGAEAADSFGVVSDLDRAKGRTASRNIGQASYQEIAEEFDKNYNQLFNEAFTAQSARNAYRNTADLGRRIDPRNPMSTRLGKDEVLVSPRYFDDIVKEGAETGRLKDISKQLNKTTKGLNKETALLYADDLYAVNKNDLRALANAFTPSKSGTGSRLSSAWKRFALASPRYIVGNRLGNALYNLSHGTRLDDYIAGINLDTPWGNLFKGSRADLIPERLKQDTSYTGILGLQPNAPTTSLIQKGLERTAEGVRELSPSKILEGIADAATGPIFRFDSNLERFDRFANFQNQARKVAAETGESLEDVLKRANTDDKLYNRLIKGVNNELGDYIGRNYYVNPRLYNAFKDYLYPFFKFPVTALKSTYKLAADTPHRYQTFVNLPAKLGNQIQEQEEASLGNRYNFKEGGVVTQQPIGRGVPTITYSEANPFAAALGFAGDVVKNPFELISSGHSPILDLIDIADYKNRWGRTASAPNTYSVGGKTYTLDNLGNPTSEFTPGTSDIAKLAIAQLANTFTPIGMYNNWIGPAAALATNQAWYPRYDASVLGQIGEGRAPEWLRYLYSGKDYKVGRKGDAIVAPWLYFRQTQVYPNREQNKKELPVSTRKRIYKKRTMEQFEKEMRK